MENNWAEIPTTWAEANATFSRLIDDEQTTPVVVLQTTRTGRQWRLKMVDDGTRTVYEVWFVQVDGITSRLMNRLTDTD